MPVLARGVHVVEGGKEGGVAAHAAGVGVGEVTVVVLDEVVALFDEFGGEHVEAVIVSLLIGGDERGELFLDEGLHHEFCHGGVHLHDRAFEVARHHALLLLLEGGDGEIILDKLFRLGCLQVVVERHGERAALSHDFHHLHPRRDFCRKFGLVGVGEELVGGVGDDGKLLLHALHSLGVVAIGNGSLESLSGSLESHRLVHAAQAVAIGTEVDVVLAEHVESLCVGGHEVFDGAFPRSVAVVGGFVPREVGDAIKREHGGFGIFHGVGRVAAHHVGDVEVVAEGRAHEEMAAAVVGHGIVEPDVSLAADARVHPFEVALVDEVHHGVARPHDAHLCVHIVAQGVEILVARPGAVIVGGAEDKRLHAVVLSHKLIGDVVEQLRLLHAARALARDVIEEHGKGAHAKAVHKFEFLDHVERVGLVPFNIYAGVNGPHEVHLILVRLSHEFLHLVGFGRGVVLTPAVAVVGVVLRAVDIDVHLVASVELELADAVGLAPVVSVEAFHHAALQHVGPVFHGHLHHFGLCGYLQEGLHAVERAVGVVAGNHHFARLHFEVVAFGFCGDFALVGCHGGIAALADNDFHVGAARLRCAERGEGSHGIGISLFAASEFVGGGAVECLCAPLDVLRNGRYGDLLRRCLSCAQAEQQGKKDRFDFHDMDFWKKYKYLICNFCKCKFFWRIVRRKDRIFIASTRFLPTGRGGRSAERPYSVNARHTRS